MYFQETFWRIQKPKNLYDSLLPLYIFTKIVGLCPYSYTKIDGKYKYRPSIFGSTYSISIILLFAGYYIFQVEQSNSEDTIETNKIANTIDMFQIYGGIVIMTVSVVSNIFQQKTLTEAIDKITEFDRKFNEYMNYKSKRNYTVCGVLLILTIFGSLEYMNCSMYLRQVGTLSTYCFLMCYVPMVMNALVEYQFITFINIIQERFSLLNENLSKMGEKSDKWNHRLNQIHPIRKTAVQPSIIIRHIRRNHALLCNSAYEINQAYSLQILLNTAHIFINFTTLGYYCFDGAMKLYLKEEDSNMYNTVTTGIWTLFKILQLLNITLSCAMIKREAHLTGEVVFKTNNRFDPNIAYEINAFVKQIIHWNFKLTALNLFDLDMELFYSAISASTTYLMILLQLDIANKQSEEAMKLSKNYTATL